MEMEEWRMKENKGKYENGKWKNEGTLKEHMKNIENGKMKEE